MGTVYGPLLRDPTSAAQEAPLDEKESRRLEALADDILKKDAKRRGFVAPTGRGYTKYERDAGITSESGLRRVYEHEAVGFSEEELDHLAHESETDAVRRRRDLGGLDDAERRATGPRRREIGNVEYSRGNPRNEEGDTD